MKSEGQLSRKLTFKIDRLTSASGTQRTFGMKTSTTASSQMSSLFLNTNYLEHWDWFGKSLE